MVKEHHVHGYEEFTKLAESLESTGETVHILFSGGKDETGQSWCPYCVRNYFYCLSSYLFFFITVNIQFTLCSRSSNVLRI